MTIFAYSGKPGAGKSYSVVEHVIIPALKKGRTVYHNMMLNEDRLRAICGDEGQLVQFSREATPAELVAAAPAGAVILIDESSRYWPAGIRANKVPAAEIEFFTMHRHRVGPDGRATDIVVICQDLGSQCAAFIRELIQFTYYSVKLSHIGMAKKYRLEVYEGCVKGDSPAKSKLVRKSICRYRPEIYACYTSHTMSEKGIAGEEIRDTRATVWKNWKVIAAGVAVIVAPIMVLIALSSVRTFASETARKGAAAEHSEAAAPASGPVVTRSIQTRAATPAVQPSKFWRLAGEITIDRIRRFALDSPAGTRYVVASACTLDPAGNRSCLVDGEIVTEWTGVAPAAFNSWFQSSAEPQAH